MHGQLESPNTSFQAVELNPSCSGQAHPNRSGTGRGHKIWSLENFHSTPFYIYDMSPLKRGCQVWQSCPKDSAKLAQTGVWILVSLGEHLSTHLKDHIRGLIKVQISTVSQGECRSQSAKLSWLEA